MPSDSLVAFCSNISADDMLYTETDLEESMDKIETINFHEVKEVAGIKFWCYHAGHVLGAAMFMIEIAGVKVRAAGRCIPVEVTTVQPSEAEAGGSHIPAQPGPLRL